jgi:hypothetical protein
LPVAWHILSACPPNWIGQWPKLRTLFASSQIVPQAQKPLRGWWVVLAPFCGWLFYLLLMSFWTGNPFEGFSAQKYWGVHSVSNLWNLPKFVLQWFTPSTWHDFSGSLLDRCVFTLLVCCLPLICALDKKFIAWVYVLGILPAMSGMFTSYTRFASVVFPIFIALGVSFSPPSRLSLRYGLLATFATFHVILLWRYVNFQWAG